MSERKAIPSDLETSLLTNCARRCALCFGLNGDLSRKNGQIAHIDQNPANNADRNLVYLCLPHHDEYDGKTSQSKGITEHEVAEYKRRLVAAITAGEHARAVGQLESRHEERLGHDRRIF